MLRAGGIPAGNSSPALIVPTPRSRRSPPALIPGSSSNFRAFYCGSFPVFLHIPGFSSSQPHPVHNSFCIPQKAPVFLLGSSGEIRQQNTTPKPAGTNDPKIKTTPKPPKPKGRAGIPSWKGGRPRAEPGLCFPGRKTPKAGICHLFPPRVGTEDISSVPRFGTFGASLNPLEHCQSLPSPFRAALINEDH